MWNLNIYTVCLFLSHVQLFATPQTVASPAPLSMGFSRQEYWSGSPFICELIYRTKVYICIYIDIENKLMATNEEMGRDKLGICN